MNAPAPASAFRRSLADAVAGLNAPIAPGADPAGVVLLDVPPRGCRFPVAHPASGVRFCAEEIPVDDWRRGSISGSYCRFHRDWLAGQPSVADDAREGL